ncbi:MAG: epimerase, partial [Oerskovia sp.]|nr:epimerase [Oerskovia sp.]
SGAPANVADLLDDVGFHLVEADVSRGDLTDVVDPLAVDLVLHLASSASPTDYLRRPLETLDAGSSGTRNALELAEASGARFVLASTSEVYGDPVVHPQPEDYWGNVNPVGPRSVYDEAKRFAEALTTAYRGARGVDTGIARIFNTYGPRMRPDDGRMIPTFITQALAGEPLTVAGDGSQTRSVCYVDDLVEGLTALAVSEVPGPVNLGSHDEMTVAQVAADVLRATGAATGVVQVGLPTDDPRQRRPDTTLAERELGWHASTPWDVGLARTVDWFVRARSSGGALAAGPIPGAGLAAGPVDTRRQGA